MCARGDKMTKLITMVKTHLYDEYVVKPLLHIVFTGKGDEMTATDIIKAHRFAVRVKIAGKVIGILFAIGRAIMEVRMI